LSILLRSPVAVGRSMKTRALGVLAIAGVARSLDGVAPLCAELSDGRLSYLAGGPFSAEEVGMVACNMVANMFSNGSILASPSDGTTPIYTYPNGTQILQNNYYNMWQRDAGLTMLTLLRVARGAPEGSPAVLAQTEAYATLLKDIWRNPSPNSNCAPSWGNFGSGAGWCSQYGEPKFSIDGSVYTESWGRNQNDGPAVNARVLMELLEFSPSSEALVKDSIISALNYVGTFAIDSTVDPWEMLYGQHFFVQSIQHRALAEATELASKLGWTGTINFQDATNMVETLVKGHWNATSGVVGETTARSSYGSVSAKCFKNGVDFTDRSGPCELDVATLLGSLYSKAAPSSATLQVMPTYDSRILATADLILRSMAPTYEVNSLDDAAGLPGALIGRYPGDEYTGVIMSEGAVNPCQGSGCGNPWFMTTFALGQVLFEAAAAAAQGTLVTDDLNRQFLVDAIDLGLPASQRGLNPELPSTAVLASQLLKGGDGILARARHHAGEAMHMSEQIYRGDGKLPPLTPGQMVGVRDLTWSYASLLDALSARAEAVAAIAAQEQSATLFA